MQCNRHSVNSFKVRSSQFLVHLPLSLPLARFDIIAGSVCILPLLCRYWMCTHTHSAHSRLICAEIAVDAHWMRLYFFFIQRTRPSTILFSSLLSTGFFFCYDFLFLNINFRYYSALFFRSLRKIRPSWQLLNASLSSPEKSSTAM